MDGYLYLLCGRRMGMERAGGFEFGVSDVQGWDSMILGFCLTGLVNFNAGCAGWSLSCLIFNLGEMDGYVSCVGLECFVDCYAT